MLPDSQREGMIVLVIVFYAMFFGLCFYAGRMMYLGSSWHTRRQTIRQRREQRAREVRNADPS
jgi:hypothetical protein